jgi:D-alanyl-D-alanine carboxypeptidase (penicillin-binding protein 5/6)
MAALVLVSALALGGYRAWPLLQRAGRPHPSERQAQRLPRLAATRPTRPALLPAFGTTWLDAHPSPPLDVHATSAILIDAGQRQVLWARDPDARRAPASLAKLVTVLVAMQLAGSLDQVVTVPATISQLEGDATRMGLQPGEQVSVADLMYGIFMVSANDAAETLAQAFVPRSRFIQLMNREAQALGMWDSHFSNPTGLDDPDLYSTASDLAVAADAVLTEYPQLVAIAGTRQYTIPATSTHPAFYLANLNELIGTYPGATGLKTGFTDDAGYCLAATATRGGRTLIAIVLGSDTHLNQDAAALLNYGFGIPAGSVPPYRLPAVDLLTQ